MFGVFLANSGHFCGWGAMLGSGNQIFILENLIYLGSFIENGVIGANEQPPGTQISQKINVE